MFIHVNKNPKNRKTDDSVVRAICRCINKSYDEIYKGLFNQSLINRYTVFDKYNVNQYLKRIGFMRVTNYKQNKKQLTVDEVSKIIKEPAIVFVGKHLTCIKNGNIYDTVDVSLRKANSVYVYYG